MSAGSFLPIACVGIGQLGIGHWVSTGQGCLINVLVKNNLIYVYRKFSFSACSVPGHMVPDPTESVIW